MVTFPFLYSLSPLLETQLCGGAILSQNRILLICLTRCLSLCSIAIFWLFSLDGFLVLNMSFNIASTALQQSTNMPLKIWPDHIKKQYKFISIEVSCNM